MPQTWATTTPMRRSRTDTFWVVALLAFWSAPDASSFGQAGGPTLVEVGEVRRDLLAPTAWLVGTVRPRVRTVVASEVAGLVAEMCVDEGDAVTQGQFLCKLRDVRTRFAVAEAAARVSENEGVLAERMAELGKAAFEKKRTERLWRSQQCSEKEYNDTQADYDAATSRVEQAKSRVEAQKATRDALADSLARMEIRSPTNGFIVTKRAEIGSWVEQGGPVVELVDASTARIRVPVPEAAVVHCEIGAMATITVEALKKPYTGQIARIIPDADERARTFPVEIDVPNPTGELKPGMFVRAAIPTGPKAEHLVVPKDAVVPRGPASSVFAIRIGPDGPMAMPVPVVVVAEVLDQVAVVATGLQAGDQVVVRGNEYMFAPGPVMVAPGGAERNPPNENASPGMSLPGAKAPPPASQPTTATAAVAQQPDVVQ